MPGLLGEFCRFSSVLTGQLAVLCRSGRVALGFRLVAPTMFVGSFDMMV